MDPTASQEAIDDVVRRIESFDCSAHVSSGSSQTVIGVIGDTRTVAQAAAWGRLEGVEKVIRVMEPYKLVSRQFKPESTVVEVRNTAIGDGSFTPIAGPCAVETRDQLTFLAGHKCDRIQGFLVSPPLPVEDCSAFLKAHA